MGDSSSVFDRLYRTSTASWEAKVKSKTARTATITRTQGVKTTSPSRRPGGGTAPNIVSPGADSTGEEGRDPPGSAVVDVRRKEAERVETTTTLYNGAWILTCTSKNDTSNPKEAFVLSPGSLKLEPMLQDYERGILNERSFASSLITALFERDFMPGEHWDIDAAVVSDIVGHDDDGNSTMMQFNTEKQATWDWKDIYSVASAKGVVCFDKNQHQISVKEYSYYVSG